MIREIKWKSHPILGDLVLDLTKPDGTVFNSIVLAGENGTGKTTILETLSTFLNRGSISQFEYIKYEVAGEVYTIQPREEDQYADAGWHVRTKESTGEQKNISVSKGNNPRSDDVDAEDIRHYIELYGYLQSKVALSLGKTECSVKECDTYITQQTDYNAAIHRKPSAHVMSHHTTNYETLPTFIRNAIDHPDPTRTFTQQELRISIELLINLC